jgi:SPP1 gp7 family putative phage head morphogenesis protein
MTPGRTSTIEVQKRMDGLHEHIARLEPKAPRHLSANTDNTATHKAADANYNTMMLAVSYGFLKGKQAVNKVALKSATTERQMHEAVDGAPEAIRTALMRSLPKALGACLSDSGQRGMESITRTKKIVPRAALANPRALKDKPSSPKAGMKVKFNATSPDAIKWAKEHGAKLAKDLSDTSRDDIRDAIASALEGEGLDSAYDDILDAVGNEARAEMISRTEAMDAANEGLAQSWDQAVSEGLLTGNEKKVWIATSDACPECEDVDGEEVPMDDDFSVGDDPPLHPNCRCTMGLVGE